MELLLNRKSILFVFFSIIISIFAVVQLQVPKPPPINKNGKDKIPIVTGGIKIVKDGVTKLVRYSFKHINKKRHVIQNISRNSKSKIENTLVDSRIVNMTKDVNDINAGLAKRVGTDFILKNGNIYRAKSISSGANLFPLKGKGIFNLSRKQFNILRELKRHGGTTKNFHKWFNSYPPVTKQDLVLPLKVYKSIY